MLVQRKAKAENAGDVQSTCKEVSQMNFSLGSLSKYFPLAAIGGYAMVYNAKGWNMIMQDLTTISIDRIQSHWQQLAIAAGAAVAVYLLKGMRLPPILKQIGTLALWFIAGYNLALAVDPPAITYKGNVTYVPPKAYNPYLLTGV